MFNNSLVAVSLLCVCLETPRSCTTSENSCRIDLQLFRVTRLIILQYYHQDGYTSVISKFVWVDHNPLKGDLGSLRLMIQQSKVLM